MKSKLITTLVLLVVSFISYSAGWSAAKKHHFNRYNAVHVPPHLAGKWVLTRGWVVGAYDSEAEAIVGRSYITEFK